MPGGARGRRLRGRAAYEGLIDVGGGGIVRDHPPQDHAFSEGSMPATRSLKRLVYELKRRRVFQVTGMYIVAAFAVLQGAGIVVPALHFPDLVMTLLVVLALVGAPVAVALAWVFDIVPGGIKRTPSLNDRLLPGEVRLRRPGAGREPGTGGVRSDPAPVLGPAAAAMLPRPPRVAVLPFLNLSPDADDDCFADGISEDVITQLSKIGALRVISLTSVLPFKERREGVREVGARLGATAVLDGSVRRAGERVRIVARLVDAETDQHLWAETYDRELTDIFAIQSEVALQIAAALEAELSSDERSRIYRPATSSLHAYQLYLQGRHWFIRYTPEGLQRAIEHFESAIAADPGYALAYANLGMAYAELSESGALEAEVARRQATEAAERALQLDPMLGEAHCTAAQLRSIWAFDWSGAEAGFRRAIELSPSGADAYSLLGRMYAALERYEEALAMQRRAHELDPLAHRLDVPTTLLRAGRYEEAASEASGALELDPAHDRALATLGWACFELGRTAEGIAQLERAVAVSPRNTQWLAQLGEALGLAGRSAEARDILRQLEERAQNGFVTPYHFAFIYTGLGEHERAMDMLERAYEGRAGAIYAIKGSFLFAPLRAHPRFQALLAKMNLA